MILNDNFTTAAVRTLAVTAIVASTVAAGVYGYRQGYFEQASDFIGDTVWPALQSDKFGGLIEKDPRHIVIGIDITSGREGELEKDRKAISGIVKNARLGDRIDIYLIHSRSEAAQESVFTVEMPTEPGPMGQEVLRAKQKADKEWDACWNDKVKAIMTSGMRQQTDLFGFMRFVSTQNPEFHESKHAYLLLFTDGQQVGDGYNMERNVPTTGQLDKIKSEGLLPELDRINVCFVGVTPTHKVTNAHWRKLQDFWKEYSREAGAATVSVTSDRSLRMN